MASYLRGDEVIANNFFNLIEYQGSYSVSSNYYLPYIKPGAARFIRLTGSGTTQKTVYTPSSSGGSGAYVVFVLSNATYYVKGSKSSSTGRKIMIVNGNHSNGYFYPGAEILKLTNQTTYLIYVNVYGNE